jgi:phospholipid transport system substrate-binding protein
MNKLHDLCLTLIVWLGFYHKKEINNDWKVYDVIVAGVSLVTNYRSTFSESIKNDGIDGLIKLLKVKNG